MPQTSFQSLGRSVRSFYLPLGVAALGLASLGLWVSPALAVQPQRFEHSTESDFSEGTFEGTVVTNLGDLKLAADTQAVGELPEEVAFVYDMATVEGVTYIAAGPEGRVLAWQNDAWQEVQAFEDAQVFALTVVEGQLMAAISGEASEVRVFDGLSGERGGQEAGQEEGDAASSLYASLPDDVLYVWDMLPMPTGLVLATGPEGKIFFVDNAPSSEAKVSEVLDTAQAHVLCLAAGRGPWEDHVFAGTDTDGLIYRIDAEGTPFIVYDAAEPEVSALVMAADGTLYAGTADVEEVMPGRMEGAVEEEAGRPDELEEGEPKEGEEGEGARGMDGDEVEADEELVGPPAAGRADEKPEDADLQDDVASETEEQEAEEQEAEDQEESNMAVAEPDYDALRDEVSRRLAVAAESGAMPSGTATGTERATHAARENASSSDGDDADGNAVYRIDPQGFVSEIFRESVMVFALALTDDDSSVWVATGDEGQLYRVDPAAGETTVLVDLDAKELLALSQDAAGDVWVATANPASLMRLGRGQAEEGTYVSQTLDAQQVSLWGTLRIHAVLPDAAQISVAFRSGNVADPEIGEGAGWSDWTTPQSLERDATFGPQPFETKVMAPPARFLQYRLTLRNDDQESDAQAAVTGLSIAYVMPNLAPQVTSLKATYPDFPGVDEPASPTMAVEWDASDPNEDRLTYTLEHRPAVLVGTEESQSLWLTLAEDQTDTSFEWDTRRVPDGYHDLRVKVGDGLDNPGDMARKAARRADPVLVDNTPPVIEDLQIVVSGRIATVKAVAVDALSPLHSVAYRVDNADDESPLLPDDLIYDSTREAWSINLSDLSPGPHMLSVRVTDLRGNRTFASRRFDVKP